MYKVSRITTKFFTCSKSAKKHLICDMFNVSKMVINFFELFKVSKMVIFVLVQGCEACHLRNSHLCIVKTWMKITESKMTYSESESDSIFTFNSVSDFTTDSDSDFS